MKFKISEQILEKYPQLNIGVVIARNLKNDHYDLEIQNLLRNAEKEIRQNIKPEQVIENSTISKWREIYKSFGAKPSQYRNSIEALVKRALKGELPKINPIVDIYNYTSIKYIMTVGGEDTNTIKGDLILDLAEGNEEFIPLGSDKNEAPWKGEVVYKDEKGVICRCWNWREGDRTKLTEKTKNAIIVIENIVQEKTEELHKALKELKELIEKYCKANCETKILNKDNPEENI